MRKMLSYYYINKIKKIKQQRYNEQKSILPGLGKLPNTSLVNNLGMKI